MSIKRYFKEVKRIDKGELSVREFVEGVFGVCGWAEAVAMYRIYREDGGHKIMSLEEWLEKAGIKKEEMEVPIEELKPEWEVGS